MAAYREGLRHPLLSSRTPYSTALRVSRGRYAETSSENAREVVWIGVICLETHFLDRQIRILKPASGKRHAHRVQVPHGTAAKGLPEQCGEVAWTDSPCLGHGRHTQWGGNIALDKAQHLAKSGGRTGNWSRSTATIAGLHGCRLALRPPGRPELPMLYSPCPDPCPSTHPSRSPHEH